MNKQNQYIIFFLTFILLSNCSFDRATGIWSGEEDEKRRIALLEKEQKSKLDVIRIYSTDDTFAEEILSSKSINLSEPKKNSSWEMSGLNKKNYFGNLYLSGIDNRFLKKKIGKNKFKISQIMSSPIFFNDNMILSDDTGTIFSINLNGKINWKKNIYKKVYKKINKNLTFSSHKEIIYVSDNIGFIYSINADSGNVIWIKNHGVPLKSNIKIHNNKIFLINQDNRLLCLKTEDGSKIWDIRSIKSFIKSQNLLSLAISDQGNLFALNSAGDLFKVKADNGGLYWSLNTTGSMLAHDTDFFKSSDIVISEDAIIFATSNSVHSYNLTNGYSNWRKEVGTSITPIVDGNNIFIVTNNGYFLNLDKKSGEIIWSTNILKVLKKRKRETYITGVIMGSGKIYATTQNGHIIVSSGNSGKVEYSKKIANFISSTPIIIDGSLFVLTEKSRILGFN